MSYYFKKEVNLSYDDAIIKVTEDLKTAGFGIITQINVKETFKKKLDVDFRRYQILGACNPGLAHKAILAEDKIGLMLPCNVVVQEFENGTIEVCAVDPVASMQAVKNDSLGGVACEVREKLKNVIENL